MPSWGAVFGDNPDSGQALPGNVTAAPQPRWTTISINSVPVFRQCPDCAATVADNDTAQQIHERWHAGERMRNFSGF